MRMEELIGVGRSELLAARSLLVLLWNLHPLRVNKISAKNARENRLFRINDNKNRRI